MKKLLFFLSLVLLTCYDLNSSNSINAVNIDNAQVYTVNLDDAQAILDYELFGEEGNIILPTYFNSEDGTILADSGDGQVLMAYFLGEKYHQLKEIDEQEADDENWDISVQLDLILSLLDGIAQRAMQNRNADLHDKILRGFFQI